MNYTTHILANPNLDHSGFWFVLGICLVFVILASVLYIWDIKNMNTDTYDSWIYDGIVCFLSSIVLFSAYHSFKELPVPLNQPVVATMVDYDTGMVGSGKSRHQVAYVQYRVPEGIVTFHITPGAVYQQNVTLYKQN